MAPTPKRKISTRRGGRRWAVRLAEFKKSFKDMNLSANKHKRSLTASKD